MERFKIHRAIKAKGVFHSKGPTGMITLLCTYEVAVLLQPVSPLMVNDDAVSVMAVVSLESYNMKYVAEFAISSLVHVRHMFLPRTSGKRFGACGLISQFGGHR